MGPSLKRLTTIPDDICPAFVTTPVTTEQWVVIGLLAIAVVCILNEIAHRIRTRKPKEN